MSTPQIVIAVVVVVFALLVTLAQLGAWGPGPTAGPEPCTSIQPENC